MGSFCKSGSSSTSQTINLPGYIETPLKDNLNRASDLVQQPYQAYGGQRIQDFSQDQQSAFQAIRDQQGSGQAEIDQSIAGIRNLSPAQAQTTQAMRFNQQAAQDYMNPYVTNVLDVARQRAFEADDIARQGRDKRALGADAFGSERAALVEAQAQDNLQDRLVAMEADQLAKAYGAAQQAYKTDATMDMQSQLANQKSDLLASQLNNQQAISGAQGIAGLVNAGQNLGFDQANALMQVGSQQQQMGQAGLDLAYSDFQNQQNYPYKQIGFMSDLLQGAPSGQTITNTSPTASPFQQAVGLGITGLGIYGSGGGFGSGGFAMQNLFNS